MVNHAHVKISSPCEDEKQAEATKTARLRALRLAKEAADSEAATRVIAAALPRGWKPPPNQPILRTS